MQGPDQRATQTRNRGVSGQHDNRPTFDLRKLTPPNLATRRKDSHDAPTASRNEGKVSPLVVLVERVHVVGDIGSIDFRRPLPGQQGASAFVDQRRIRDPERARRAPRQQGRVNGRTNLRPCHATTVPQMWHTKGMFSSDRSTKPRCVARDHPCHPAEAANSSHSPGTPRAQPHRAG